MSSIRNTLVQNNNIVFALCFLKQYCVYSILYLLPVSVFSGKQLSKGSGLNELLNIHNSAKVVNVKDPEPGTWTIKVKLLQNFCMIVL